MPGEFSVYQFFPNGQYEQIKRGVDAQEAMNNAVSLLKSVGGQIGTTQRVIICDGGDCIAFEWIHGQGVVFPPPPVKS